MRSETPQVTQQVAIHNLFKPVQKLESEQLGHVVDVNKKVEQSDRFRCWRIGIDWF